MTSTRLSVSRAPLPSAASLGTILALIVVSLAQAQSPPLHERIDQIIDAAAIGPLAPSCSDADFIRRIYLDLTGVVPGPEPTRAFLADASLDKRQRVIDELLASPAFVRHLTITFDVMLLERRRDKTALIRPWLEYLYTSLSSNKPLDQLYREMIAADGSDGPLRPAARFFLNRDSEPNLMTRDIGRLTFGMDLQCAQCHDHPLIDDYYQADYYGLFAFVHRTSVFNDAKSKMMLLGEKAEGEASFKSVFTQEGADGVRPQLPKGAVLYVEPTFEKGQEYVSVPAKDARGVPKFSRRTALGDMLSGSIEFRRNLANRLWALMLGRGIVHPVDFHYAANPPSHPELLTLLADELRSAGFQVRPLLREIALSRAYQRSVDSPRPEHVNFAELADRLVKLEAAKAERAAEIPVQQARLAEAKDARNAVIEQNKVFQVEIAALVTAVQIAVTASDKAAAEQKAAEDALAAVKERAALVAGAAAQTSAAAAKLPEDKAVAQASALLADRSTALTAEADAASKAAADLAASAASLLGQTKAAEAAVATARAKQPTDQLAQLDSSAHQAAHQLANTRYAIAAVDTQIATIKALQEYAEVAKTDAARAEAIWAALVEKWTIQCQVAPLKGLTPEQFAASAMRATGVLNNQEASAAAAIEKQPPASLQMAPDADKPRIRQEQVELRLIDQLDNIFNEFAKHYGGAPGADVQATATQALYFGNGPGVDGWIQPAGENLAARLVKLEDPAALSDELYLAVLSRPPTDIEREDVTTFIKDRAADKPVAVKEMIWALLSSSEFRFNH